MAGRQVSVGARLKALPSLDLDRPYPMNLEHLGHAVIVNNLRSELPQTAVDVETVSTALDTIGFTVKTYSDCNVQEMRKIKDWIGKDEIHAETNCFCLVILCNKIEQGWILDRHLRRAFTIEQLTACLSEVKTLKAKPKIVIIEESGNGSEGTMEDIPVQQDKEDFYIVCSTHPGESGSRPSYLHEFAHHLEEHFMKEPLSRIFWLTKQSLQAPVQIPRTLQDSELMTLAGKISTSAMRIVAVEKLEFEISEVKTLTTAAREDQQWLKFELLDRWKNRNPKNNRQRLAAILRETDGIIDGKMVHTILKIGQMEDQAIKQFDSFTHSFYFADFYKEKQETSDSAEPEIHPQIASQLQELQQTIQELKREKAAQEELFQTQIEKNMMEQEKKFRELETKQKETSDSTQHEIQLRLASQLQEIEAKLQMLGTEKASHEASRADKENKLKRQEEKLEELEEKRKHELAKETSKQKTSSKIPPVETKAQTAERQNEKKEEESHRSETVTPSTAKSHVALPPSSKHQVPAPATITRGSKERTILHIELNRISTHSTQLIYTHGNSRIGATVLRTGEIAFWKSYSQSIRIFSLVDGQLQTQIKVPCPHTALIDLLSIVNDNHKDLVMSCYSCETIYLINLATKQVTKVFEGCSPEVMCKGDSDRIYVKTGNSALELAWTGSSFIINNKITCKGLGYNGFCYLPDPHRALVYSNYGGNEIIANSCDKTNVLWEVKGSVDGHRMYPSRFLFSALHNALLVADSKNCRVLVLDPRNGSHMQTIQLPHVGYIVGMHFHNNQIVMLHSPQDRKVRISCFSVK